MTSLVIACCAEVAPVKRPIPKHTTAPSQTFCAGGREHAPSGDWTSGSVAFTVAHRSCGAVAYNVFGHSPLSQHALVPAAFRLQVSWVTRERPSVFSLAQPGLLQCVPWRTRLVHPHALRWRGTACTAPVLCPSRFVPCNAVATPKNSAAEGRMSQAVSTPAVLAVWLIHVFISPLRVCACAAGPALAGEVSAACGADEPSRVGRWRGAGYPTLVHRPLPKRSMPVSWHCAFPCLTPAHAGDGAAVAAVGISPTSLLVPRRHLCPFPL